MAVLSRARRSSGAPTRPLGCVSQTVSPTTQIQPQRTRPACPETARRTDKPLLRARITIRVSGVRVPPPAFPLARRRASIRGEEARAASRRGRAPRSDWVSRGYPQLQLTRHRVENSSAGAVPRRPCCLPGTGEAERAAPALVGDAAVETRSRLEGEREPGCHIGVTAVSWHRRPIDDWERLPLLTPSFRRRSSSSPRAARTPGALA